MSEPLFSQFKLNTPLLKALEEMHFIHPTPIQLACIPAALSGQDVIGISQTGTGKTAAYLIPIIKYLGYSQGVDPRALIIVPTRELVIQVHNHLTELCRYIDLRVVSLFGGESVTKQKKYLSEGCDVVVATPARFTEHYLAGNLGVKKVKFFVLDEVERLLDKSFIRQIHKVLEVIPAKRQHFLFSATMSPLVRKISEDFIAFPHLVEIKPESPATENVEQCYYKTPSIKAKIALLDFIMENEIKEQKAIVFCRTKETADNVYKYLIRTREELKLSVIHGNKQQNYRVNAFKSMLDGESQLLITTDIAARGIDLPDVSFVINFEMPVQPSDYLHRIGRTGRMYLKGKSISFVNPAEEYCLQKSEKLIKKKIENIVLPSSIELEPVSFQEKQKMAREIDFQKRKEDPEYKGAFHNKRNLKQTNAKKRR